MLFFACHDNTSVTSSLAAMYQPDQQGFTCLHNIDSNTSSKLSSSNLVIGSDSVGSNHIKPVITLHEDSSNRVTVRSTHCR